MPHTENTFSASTFSCSSHGSSSMTCSEYMSTPIHQHHHHLHPQSHSHSPPHHHHHQQLSSPSSPPSSLQPNSADSKLLIPLTPDPCSQRKLLLSPSPSPSHASNLNALPQSPNNQAVKMSIALMKLRRQGSHPPAIQSTFAHQSAAARELMASLERLSLSDQKGAMLMKNGGDIFEGEAQRSLLEGVAEEIRNRVLIKEGGALPLGAKIAAAMDAEGRIGVMQNEIADRVEGMTKERELQVISSGAYQTKMAKTKKTKKRRGRRAGGSGRWVIRPIKLRSTRAVLGKIWRNIRRLFLSSSKCHGGKIELLPAAQH